MAGLKQAYAKGELRFGGEVAALEAAAAFQSLLGALYAKEWIVYAKRPFAGAREVVRYLGRYTHQGPISNWRLRALEGDQVSFAWKDYRDGSQWKEMQLPAEEFIRRYLVHVLPAGFVHIRYYGLYAAGRRKKRLARCRELLGVPEGEGAAEPQSDTAREEGGAGEGVRGRCCEVCGSEKLVRQREWHAGERVPKWVEVLAEGLRAVPRVQPRARAA